MEAEKKTKPKVGYGNTSKYRNERSKDASEMCQFIRRYKWSHWCTFTFTDETSAYGARRQFTRLFDRFSHSGWKSCYFVVEKGTRYGRIHLHALGYWYDDESAQLVWHWWKSHIGRCEVRSHDPTGHAVEYISNYYTKKTHDWDILGSPKTNINATPKVEPLEVERYRKFVMYKKGILSKADYIGWYKQVYLTK